MNRQNQLKQEMRLESDLRTRIWSTLKDLETPSAFAVCGSAASIPDPNIFLKPYGILPLPLTSEDAIKIIQKAHRSPFGRGEETIVDTAVRKSWELNPNQFSLKNPEWKNVLKTIVDSVTAGLGIPKGKGISAKLYKLLLYQPGAFFKPHTDTEKAPGMFATLVICLPSQHEGGKLVLTHDNKSYEFETAGSSAVATSYAAWYANITHEVLPVTSGYRLMLTYNLIRKTGLETPSYELVHGREQQLSSLLTEYNLWLEHGDNKLPPFLLHKLKHKYTEVSLQLELLKPPDLGQVQILAQVANKLGFDIFLAVLELEVHTDKQNRGFIDKDRKLDNVVELDGTLLVKSFNCPNGALIDPTPQDARRADEKYCEGYTGNAGCPVTHWYRDAVAVLVPPANRSNFVFHLDVKGNVIEPLFRKLMEEFSKDPAKRPMLEQLCERAIKQKPKELYSWERGSSVEPIPSYFHQAVATILGLGRFDLFDEACQIRGDKIILDHSCIFGLFTANNGLAAMSDRLMKGIRIAPSVAEKIKFLESVAEGFKAATQDLAERARFKIWCDEAIFISVAELTTLTKADGVSLGQLCKTMDWNFFESKVTPIVTKATTKVKITFINELISTLNYELSNDQRSFIEMIIRNIWCKFDFDFAPQDPKQKSKEQQIKDDLSANDLLLVVENTIKIFSVDCVDTMIIPALFSAIPKASKECGKELFISLVRMIIKNEAVGFKLPTVDTAPPSSHKRLVQAFLTQYLKENVGLEPRASTNWSQSPGTRCKCSDCSVINRFLQDPVQQSLDFPCAKHRRRHLYESFEDCCEHPYEIETVRDSNPCIWRIFKVQREYEKAKAEWIKNVPAALQTLTELKNDEPVAGRLEAYLQPYYNIIMNVNVKELPNLKSLIAAPQLLERNENIAPNLPTEPTGHKRPANQNTVYYFIIPSKRTC